MDISCGIVIVSVWTSSLRGAQIKVFNYCSKLHLIFSSRIFKTSPVMKFALKIQSDRSELKCHCETYVQQLFIISEVFWNNRFGSFFFLGGGGWLHEWFERGRQYVCWRGDWSLRQYCQFVLPVFKEINASRLDLCFSIFLKSRPLEKVPQIMRTTLHKIVPTHWSLRHSLV